MRRSPHYRANFPQSCSSLNSRNTSASVVRSVRAISSVDGVNSFLVLWEGPFRRRSRYDISRNYGRDGLSSFHFGGSS
jgi:hypothetical protein